MGFVPLSNVEMINFGASWSAIELAQTPCDRIIEGVFARSHAYLSSFGSHAYLSGSAHAYEARHRQFDLL